MPEIQETFTQAGVDLKEIDKQMQIFSQTRPIDIAFSMFFNTLVSGIILSLLLSMIGSKVRVSKS